MDEAFLVKVGLEEYVPHLKTYTFHTIVSDAMAATASFTPADLNDIYTYKIPKLGPGGSCTRKGEYEEKPFNLAETLGLPFDNELIHHPHTLRLHRLEQVVKSLQAATLVDWLGIYRRVSLEGDVYLLKEAYLGEYSRPLFPLTEEFAAMSNNSTVGLRGKAVIIQDIAAHVGPYYNCDGKVQSEFCLPIIGKDGDVLGIIDAEAWKTQHFDPNTVLTILQVAVDIGNLNMGLEHTL